MNIQFLRVVLIALAVGLAGCQTTPESGGDFVLLKGKTDEQASKILLDTLEAKHYQVRRINEKNFFVTYDGANFMFEPVMIDGELSRILVSKFYTLRPEVESSPELMLGIGALNQGLNFAKFFIMPDQRTVQVQSQITFVDKLEVAEITKFMVWLDAGLEEISAQMPNSVKLFERVDF